MTGRDEKQDRPIEDLQAGDAFRSALVSRADGSRSGAPLWHGWALMDAFLAGIDYAREQKPYLARFMRPIDEALQIARIELSKGYLVNLREDLAWGSEQEFDSRKDAMRPSKTVN